MIKCCIVLAALLILYLLSLAGRRHHPGLEALRGWYYAHRGLHDKEKPENSLAAFAAAADRHFGMELDVHLLQDGSLAVIHDSALERTTGQPGNVEDLTEADLPRYFLQESRETIPTLPQVLDLVDGRVPLIIELKSVNGNYAALSEAVCSLLEGYRGVYCLESFDPRCIQWLRRHRPHLIRGQLAENALKIPWKMPWLLKFVMTNHMGNFLSRPDFIAYKFSDRGNLSTRLARRLWKIQGVSWTITTPEDFQTALKEGWLPIFEQFIP